MKVECSKRKILHEEIYGIGKAQGKYIITKRDGRRGVKNKIKYSFGIARNRAVGRNNYFKTYHLHY